MIRATLLSLTLVGCASPTAPTEPAVAATELLAFGLGADSASGPPYGAAACDTDPTVTFLDVCGVSVLGDATFVFDGCSVDGVTLSGTASIDSEPIADCLLQRHIEVTRSIDTGRGGTLSVALTGDLTASVSEDSVSQSGAAVVEIDHPFRGAIAFDVVLTDVVRVDPAVCEWPITGRVDRMSADGVLVVEFGPDCGQATLNGEPVDLSTLEVAGGPAHGAR